MKRLVSFLLVAVMVVTLFASCSSNQGESKEPPTEKVTVPENIKTVTLTSRIGGKALDITYDTEKVSLKESYSSEATFSVNETDKTYPNKSFKYTSSASSQSANIKSDVSLNILFSKTEYAGRLVGVGYSSVVRRFTFVAFPAFSKIFSAKSAQEHIPSQVPWKTP